MDFQEVQEIEARFKQTKKDFNSSSESEQDIDSENIKGIGGEQNLNKEKKIPHGTNADNAILTKAEVTKYQNQIEKTGVCYLSRIPPFMQPTHLRNMLEKYGKIGRIYCAPEKSQSSSKRKKFKRDKRMNYTEGWVEFLDKGLARRLAGSLNNTIMGGKKSNKFHDDIWNIKYLPKFKWHNLSEQLAYENKVKEQTLKNELSQAKKENSQYLKNVKQAKMIDAIKVKKLARNEKVQEKKVVSYSQRKIKT